LEVVNLTDELIVDVDSLPPVVFLNAGRLKYLEYRNNGIKKIIRSIIVAGHGDFTIDFSVAPDFMKISSQLGTDLKALYLSGNSLAEQLENDVNGLTLKYLHNMTLLDLARNGIKSLPDNFFHHAANLERLNLGQNSIQLFDFQLNSMSKLVELNLSYNLLASFDSYATDRLTSIFCSSNYNANMSVDLTGNPFECSCNTLPFLRWINSYQRHISRY